MQFAYSGYVVTYICVILFFGEDNKTCNKASKVLKELKIFPFAFTTLCT